MDKTLLISAVRLVFLAGLTFASAKYSTPSVQQAKACTTCTWSWIDGNAYSYCIAVNDGYYGCYSDGEGQCDVFGENCVRG
jgi:hypothetical protein